MLGKTSWHGWTTSHCKITSRTVKRRQRRAHLQQWHDVTLLTRSCLLANRVKTCVAANTVGSLAPLAVAVMPAHANVATQTNPDTTHKEVQASPFMHDSGSQVRQARWADWWGDPVEPDLPNANVNAAAVAMVDAETQYVDVAAPSHLALATWKQELANNVRRTSLNFRSLVATLRTMQDNMERNIVNQPPLQPVASCLDACAQTDDPQWFHGARNIFYMPHAYWNKLEYLVDKLKAKPCREIWNQALEELPYDDPNMFNMLMNRAFCLHK